MTTVINLLAGSGVGKSTTAALIFGEMKLMGLHCELVREFVKEWAWEGRKVHAEDQPVIYENQLAREKMYYNKLDYVVTDSPLLLCPMYQKFYTGTTTIEKQVFDGMCEAEQNGIVYLNFVLQRNKKFDPRGRYETADQAKEVDAFLVKYLDEHSIPFYSITRDDKARVNDIIHIVLEKQR